MRLLQFIQDIAKKIKNDQLEALLTSRTERGFRAYIHDLKDEQYDESRPGWTLKKGHLTVQLNNPNLNPDALQAYLNLQFRSLNAPWFQAAPPEGFDSVKKPDYHAPFKVLGQYGANPAIDPIFLMQQQDGLVRVLTIKRKSGEFALPGGMQEGRVLDNCIKETLEECYSGDLFEEGSLSLAVVESNPELSLNALQTTLTGTLQTTLPEAHQATLNAVIAAAETKEALLPAFLNAIQALNTDEHPTFNTTTRTQYLTHTKMALYQQLCPGPFEHFKDFIQAHSERGKKVMHHSDPRNTNHAWMVTTPLYITLTADEMNALEDTCALRACAGDDAVSTHFMALDQFCCDPSVTFAAHAAFVLDGLAHAIETRKLSLRGGLLTQLHTLNTAHGEAFRPTAVNKYIEEQQNAYKRARETLSVFNTTDLADENSNAKTSRSSNDDKPSGPG